MDRGSRKEAGWPFEQKSHDSEHKIDNLQDRKRLDGHIEVLGEEIPEDFGPEEAFEGCSDLICGRKKESMSVKAPRPDEQPPDGGEKRRRRRTNCRSQHDEACPVVLDESAHVAGF